MKKYKYYNECGYIADLNFRPNPKTILGIVSTVSVLAQIQGTFLEKIKTTENTITTIIYLRNIYNDEARDLLQTFYEGMHQQGMKHLENGFHTPTLDFALALKSAMDIMSSTEGQYYEAWKKALGDKLTETQALLEQKMEKLKRKQAKATRKPGFWDQQPPSSSDENTSTSQSDFAL